MLLRNPILELRALAVDRDPDARSNLLAVVEVGLRSRVRLDDGRDGVGDSVARPLEGHRLVAGRTSDGPVHGNYRLHG